MIKKHKTMAALALVLTLSLVACTTDQVFADINLLIQIAAAIMPAVQGVSAQDEVQIQKISDMATTGMSVIQKDYAQFKASGATTDLDKVVTAATVLQSNLQAELAAIHIANADKATKVTNWVNLIVTTLKAVIAALPQFQAKMQAHKAGGMKLPSDISPRTLKARWTTEVCQGDQRCAVLVR